MSDGDEETKAQELVIIRRSAGGEEDGHHGGVWKIAYADFMTAMMAFFLVMWLINCHRQEDADAGRHLLQSAAPDRQGARRPGACSKPEAGAQAKDRPERRAQAAAGQRQGRTARRQGKGEGSKPKCRGGAVPRSLAACSHRLADAGRGGPEARRAAAAVDPAARPTAIPSSRPSGVRSSPSKPQAVGRGRKSPAEPSRLPAAVGTGQQPLPPVAGAAEAAAAKASRRQQRLQAGRRGQARPRREKRQPGGRGEQGGGGAQDSRRSPQGRAGGRPRDRASWIEPQIKEAIAQARSGHGARHRGEGHRRGRADQPHRRLRLRHVRHRLGRAAPGDGRRHGEARQGPRRQVRAARRARPYRWPALQVRHLRQLAAFDRARAHGLLHAGARRHRREALRAHRGPRRPRSAASPTIRRPRRTGASRSCCARRSHERRRCALPSPLLALAGALRAAHGQERRATPGELVRSLRAAAGRDRARRRRGPLCAEGAARRISAEQLLAAKPEVWKEPRNARAAVAFVLSGGDARLLKKLVAARRPAGRGATSSCRACWPTAKAATAKPRSCWCRSTRARSIPALPATSRWCRPSWWPRRTREGAGVPRRRSAAGARHADRGGGPAPPGRASSRPPGTSTASRCWRPTTCAASRGRSMQAPSGGSSPPTCRRAR